MSDFLAPVEPLKSLKPDGQPCTRRPHVETQLGRLHALPPSERAAEIPHMYPECVLHLLRLKEADEELYERLWKSLMGRIVQTVRRTAWALPKSVIQDIAEKVQHRILELLFAEPPDLAIDFYEIGFTEGIKALTIDAIRVHENSILGSENRGWLKTPNEAGVDGQPYERPFELVPDIGASPEETAIEVRIQEQRAEKAQAAYDAVEDPLDREVVRLHFEEDIPVWSSDPEQDAVAKRLDLREGQARHRYKRGMKQMHQALSNGEQNDVQALL
jgi:hypothetical protein